MAVACGRGFTVVVVEKGDLWSFGKGASGQLGLGTDKDQLLPALVGGACGVFDGEAVVMVAAGTSYTAGVTKDGALWSWGEGYHGQLGHGDSEPRQRPERLGREMFDGSPAVMVACGGGHMLVLTAMGLVWSCGFGGCGQLGGDAGMQLVLTLVAAERFGGAQIVMVAAGAAHSVALGTNGRVWTWGSNDDGQLGHNDTRQRLVPTQLAGKALGWSATVMVAAGGFHTVAVMIDGVLWAWGHGRRGKLGLGDEHDRLVPARVGAEEEFGGSPVLMAACGDLHTLAVTKAGTLWSWGGGKDGRLGHDDENNRLVPTQVEAQHFGDAKIVSATAGHAHSAAVTEHGGLYTWGTGTRVESDDGEVEVPWGLGHGDGETKSVPTRLAPALLLGMRVGRCYGLPPLHALAFAMGNHSRLGRAAQTAPAAAHNGKDCAYVSMPGELVQRIVEACGTWPEGRAGQLEGVVRLLGGGMIDERESTLKVKDEQGSMEDKV